ncbi:MAG: FAD:protein FMN transferase [Ardenticatenaceae bacterium]|nr:FAD:protein FMN transferase [Ardenticatenaceae bacterium]
MMIVTEVYPPNWHRHEFRAMGCEMAIWLETADAHTAATAFAAVEALFAAHEQALSRFRADSELSQLNAGSGEWVVVSDLMWEVLLLALQMAAVTNGRFDPTTLNALEQHGYTVSFEQLGAGKGNGRFPSPPSPDWTAVKRDEARQAVYLPQGVRLDLGGIAKGYTAQKAVDLLQSWGPCLVDAGGDLVAGDAPLLYHGWPVAISSPLPENGEEPGDLCALWLANQALATSGVDYRHWRWNGRPAHHLIDPATGQPAETDGVTVTILADEAVIAEAWATATLIAGSQMGMTTLLDAGLAGLMVLRNGRILATPPMHQHLQMAAA